MQVRQNRRGHTEHFWDGVHLKLDDLKQKAREAGLNSQYLYKENIPEYPKPELHVIRLKHDTNKEGLSGIRKDEGFKDPCQRDPGRGLVWWYLYVGPEEVRSVETRLLEKTFPDWTKEQADTQQSLLWKFATSPAFKETSRLGSYRFTFPLEEVLWNYSQQFCSGQQPVMRVYETVLYKQEFQYTVLVHSPANEEQFSRFPLLSDHPNAVCVYRDGRFVWRPEAMCETHSYELVQKPDEKEMKAQELFGREIQFYVWDIVAIALYVDKEVQVLKFGADRLRENLSFCEKDEVTTSPYWEFVTPADAEVQVNKLWSNGDMKLKEEISLEQSFTAAGGGPVKLEEDMEYM
ncbi:uncharacterized protein LOC125021503 isoform X2 [Mugil cephalus]|uniref:uncharacterized protein LOC125021503 isoform X2 n=1 Tax=Mugil cephalus TaxID=48193 RepID=UPI001FB7C3AF|nr:uncharacterized protein LOC125021503 isoform X2 [Mugil cephalus]